MSQYFQKQVDVTMLYNVWNIVVRNTEPILHLICMYVLFIYMYMLYGFDEK